QHGLSLTNAEWARGHFAENYTFEHAGFILKAIQDGTLPASEEELAKIDELAHRVYGEKEAMPEVAVWPELALSWLKTVQGRD
ncbi:MAG: alpha/beta hydrolase, partial [Lachnospiraceae bacterium]|nr:alpha/beta hydrolase [Lachnospiraceae bacterium]